MAWILVFGFPTAHFESIYEISMTGGGQYNTSHRSDVRSKIKRPNMARYREIYELRFFLRALINVPEESFLVQVTMQLQPSMSRE